MWGIEWLCKHLCSLVFFISTTAQVGRIHKAVVGKHVNNLWGLSLYKIVYLWQFMFPFLSEQSHVRTGNIRVPRVVFLSVIMI